MKKILFLCTGNYYRSRFAEHLFNTLAQKNALDWQADSRGLAVEREINNIGAMSRYAVEALKQRQVIISEEERLPQPTSLVDFQTADRVIVLDELEHRPLMQERFPLWLDKVEYWLVHDIDRTSADEALGQIEVNIQKMIEELATPTSPSHP